MEKNYLLKASKHLIGRNLKIKNHQLHLYGYLLCSATNKKLEISLLNLKKITGKTFLKTFYYLVGLKKNDLIDFENDKNNFLKITIK